MTKMYEKEKVLILARFEELNSLSDAALLRRLYASLPQGSVEEFGRLLHAFVMCTELPAEQRNRLVELLADIIEEVGA